MRIATPRGTALAALAALSLVPALAAGPDLSWMEIRLSRDPGGRHTDRNEGITLADVDRDGRTDVIAGGWWYRAPNWERHVLRDLKQDAEFAQNNGDMALDVDGDGWTDVITGSWFEPDVRWFRNPGKEGLEKGVKWEARPIGKLGACEGKLLHDFDGCGTPELVLDSWEDNVPVHIFKVVRAGGEVRWEDFAIGKRSGHGMGIGDVNGDGHADVVVKDGWYESPAEPFKTTDWAFHQELNLGHTGVPFLVRDVNGDGLTDILFGEGHDYGLTWLEQAKGADGKREWKRHEIEALPKKGDPGDPSPREGMVLSQVHVIVAADLDGDGKPEYLTGKRLRGHGDGDGGWKEPIGLYYYSWDAGTKTFARHVISESPGIAGRFGKSANEEMQMRGAVGTGMQICVQDLNGDGRPDVAVAGKSGTYLLINQPDAR